MRSPTRTLAATTLVFEAMVVFFAGLVAKDLSSLGSGRALALAGGLAVACLLTAGLLRSPAGYVLGSVLQVAVVASGVWVTAMIPLGLVFAALWFAALRFGRRAEAQAAERWAAAERAEQPERSGETSGG